MLYVKVYQVSSDFTRLYCMHIYQDELALYCFQNVHGKLVPHVIATCRDEGHGKFVQTNDC